MKRKLPRNQTISDDDSGTPAVSVPREPRRPELCNFAFADGRSCRMLRAKKHKCLCVFHAREERELLSAQEAARRLVSLSGEFKTASDVNRVLGQLFLLLANQRIARKDALSLAYVAQLLLQSLPNVRYEIQGSLGYRDWHDAVKIAHDLPPASAYTGPPPKPVFGSPDSKKRDNSDG